MQTAPFLVAKWSALHSNAQTQTLKTTPQKQHSEAPHQKPEKVDTTHNQNHTLRNLSSKEEHFLYSHPIKKDVGSVPTDSTTNIKPQKKGQKMTLHKITLGDYSGDGHNISETYIIEIPNNITYETLKTNYNNNVEKFGFTPNDFAEEYEDRTIPEEYVTILKNNGLQIQTPKQVITQEDKNSVILEAETLSGATFYSLYEPREMVKIIMHFFGHGIPNFEWKEYAFENPALIGANSTINKNTPGYGLFI